MTRINKSKDGRIGPEPKPGIVLPPPGSTEGTSSGTVGASVPTTKTKPLHRMNKAELADVALSRQIDVADMTKKQMLVALE